MKSVQIRSFFWSVFSRIGTEYGPGKPLYLGTFQTVHYTVNNLIETIDNDIGNLLAKIVTLSKSNLSIKEKEALKELANRDDLIISKADKGGATVMQDIDSYI